MTLVYRAIWTDAEHHAVRVLDDEFRAWCQSKGIEPEDLPVRGTAVFDGKRVDVRRGDAEFGQVLRVSLSEDAEAGRVWTTTATAFYRPDLGGTYWVDLDCETTPEDRIPLAAPRLVRQILEEPGDPVRGTVPLSVEPIPAVGVEAGAGLDAGTAAHGAGGGPRAVGTGDHGGPRRRDERVARLTRRIFFI